MTRDPAVGEEGADAAPPPGWADRALDLILARHGSTAWTHPYRRYQGRTDVALSARGRLDAERLAAELAGRGVAAIWHSPLARARDTAAAAGRHLGLPVTADARLIELGFGAWEGRSHASVRRTRPELVRRRGEDVLGFAPPGGERISSLLRRVRRFLLERSAAGGGTQLAVAHEGVIRAAAVCLGLVGVDDFYSVDVPCGGAVRVRTQAGGGWELEAIACPAEVLDPLLARAGAPRAPDGEVA